MIAGEETFPLRTSQTSIEVHRTASGCTPPPASEANTQVSAVPVRGWVPGVGGSIPLLTPIDQPLTCTNGGRLLIITRIAY
jgi:hypothetical protein